METQEERQQQEITALQSIFADDFIESPPPKAWKGAPRLPEFVIKVSPPEPSYTNKIYFHLNVKFPKTYPSVACPTFTIQPPMQGLSPHDVTKLNNEIHAEAQRNRGAEMVFQVVTYAQEWILANVKPAQEVSGSLASQMTKRFMEEEKARQQRQEEEAEKARLREAERAKALEEEIAAEFHKQQMERERAQRQSRARAFSDATEIPVAEDATLTETFAKTITFQGASFSSVKLFHPKQDGLGTVYQAEPISEHGQPTLPLELLSVTFVSHHYTTAHGRKKLHGVEEEIKKLTKIQHQNLLGVLAVKLTTPSANSAPRLLILTEQRPPVTLRDVLEHTDSLREERVSEYLAQILSAMSILHDRDIPHRGLRLDCIGLAPRDGAGPSKIVKLYKAAYHVWLRDLDRSNPFGFNADYRTSDEHIPDGWLHRDAMESQLAYTKCRDIHDIGIVLLQMLMGLDVTERFPNPQVALQNSTISPFLQQKAISMLLQTNLKKVITCQSLLHGLQDSPYTSRTQSISFAGPKTPRPSNGFQGSPEMDYFKMSATPAPVRQHSRWHEDWEQLEELGAGGFGEVWKARNKIDGRIYAVKRIRLRGEPTSKIFREVDALSRVNHRYIVRYYTTWVETSDQAAPAPSSDSENESSASRSQTDGRTSVPYARSRSGAGSDDLFGIDFDDMASVSRHSFPSIHFTNSGDGKDCESDPEEGGTDGEDIDDDIFGTSPMAARTIHGGKDKRSRSRSRSRSPMVHMTRTLYIQMEFVERQTLFELCRTQLTFPSEEEAWRLFLQILDALVHMASLGILHRDIKLSNIFIDGKGDCKIGDFGLATSNLPTIDMQDTAARKTRLDAEATLDVGTRLYIAPEVQSGRAGPRSQAKADMYSLGIVFFEMNHYMRTLSERAIVLEQLRRPTIDFPPDWEPHRSRQRQIIEWLLQHNPASRPTAPQCSQSPLLPPRLEDEFFKNAMTMIANPESPHHQAVLSALFNQTQRPSTVFVYDTDEATRDDHYRLNEMVEDRLSQIFRLHGAVHMEPNLFMPVISAEEDRERVTFIDRHGEIIGLPTNGLAQFARLAARDKLFRIKRYHVGDTFRANTVSRHPRMSKSAIFDVITIDLESASLAATAEAISIVNECLDNLADMWQQFEFRLSHSNFAELALQRVPIEQRPGVMEILKQVKSSHSQKRALLVRRGIPRNIVDELEVLAETHESVDALTERLDKVAPHLLVTLHQCLEDLRKTVQSASIFGVTKPLRVCVLLMSSPLLPYFENGVCFEVVHKRKRDQILATGGRYDNLIKRYSPPGAMPRDIFAVAVHISLEKITSAVAIYHNVSSQALLKEQRSFGHWALRRCEVYVVSYQPGFLSERLEIATMLWQAGISADVMYESGGLENENILETCEGEGIYFIVHPKPRVVKGAPAVLKVKSVLRGTETEVTRQELASFLHQQIAEQKRIDALCAGTATQAEKLQPQAIARDSSSGPDVQLVLPGDVKKQKKMKGIFLDRAHEAAAAVKAAASAQGGIPTVAVDVPTGVFEEMARSTAWLTDEESWKAMAAAFPTQQPGYAHQIKEAVVRRKLDGHRFVLLYGVKQERVAMLTLG